MMIMLQNSFVYHLLNKQMLQVRREDKTSEQKVKIIKSLTSIYQGLDELLQDDKIYYDTMNQIHDRVSTKVK